MSIEQKYASRMRKETGLFAAWAPNAPIAIGDFGPVDGAVFQIYGQLGPDDVKSLNLRPSPSPASYDVLADARWGINADVKARAEAHVAEGKALLQVGFSAEDGFSFTAPKASIEQATDLQALGRILNDRRLQNRWNMDHAVVVEVTATTKATILISNKAGARMDFEVAADAPLNAELIASLEAKTSVLWADGVRTRVVGEGPLTPLFRLAWLRSRIFRAPEVVYRESVPEEGLTQIDIDEEYVLAVY